MSKTTHRAIATTGRGIVSTIDVPTPHPKGDEVLIKVGYSSMIAFDSYMTDLGYFVSQYPVILGFNASGTVVEVGEAVTELAKGDNVTVFSMGGNENKGMQEYTVISSTLCAKVPSNVPLDSAATIPDNFVTAYFTVFTHLGLKAPTTFPATTAPENANEPVLIYGAGTTASQYMIQLLRLAGYTSILATASPAHHDFVKSLGAAHVFDYNSPSLVQDIARTVGGDGKVGLAMDPIASEATLNLMAGVVRDGGVLAVLMPIKVGKDVNGILVQSADSMKMELPSGLVREEVQVKSVRTFLYQQDAYLKNNLLPKILPELLEKELIKPSRVRLLNEGSFEERVRVGLELTRKSQVRGEKLIVQVEV